MYCLSFHKLPIVFTFGNLTKHEKKLLVLKEFQRGIDVVALYTGIQIALEAEEFPTGKTATQITGKNRCALPWEGDIPNTPKKYIKKSSKIDLQIVLQTRDPKHHQLLQGAVVDLWSQHHTILLQAIEGGGGTWQVLRQISGRQVVLFNVCLFLQFSIVFWGAEPKEKVGKRKSVEKGAPYSSRTP